ncbi:hypothetical protein PHYPSEUDO_004864 [Phytophthora pseudosyringae]|uniref:Uncharacterized protein n=1 Tax=Phytophthora pseudosyringae TaxID=221518 RepID=A0A8T1VQX4_9STRA|nr:hypothetical protein PHYPSEUDO_004864 [Phytophthora pseudosyringae]
MLSTLHPRSATTSLLLAGFLTSVALARVTDRTLFLSTYSDDFACSNIVYARIDNDICTDTSVCAILNDTDGSFHDTEMTACILDREAFLKSAFKGAPYLTVELYPDECLGKSYNTRSFIADGNCHPYAHNHFKVIQANGTTSVWSAQSGCESDDWYEEWSVDSVAELNTEACVSDGARTWRSYFVAGTTNTEDSTSNPPTTTAATPTTVTSSPTATVAPSTAIPSTLPSSLATSRSTVASTAALLVAMALSAAMIP